MLAEIIERIRELLNAIFVTMGFVATDSSLEDGKLRIFIKHHTGGTGVIPLDLDPKWSIEQVKEQASHKLHIEPGEMKIILAGKELPDHIVIEDCNIGQHSFLHAVQVQVSRRQGTVDSLLPQSKSTEVESQAPVTSHQFFQNEIHQHRDDEEAHTETHAPTEEVEETVEADVAVVTPKSNFYVYCGHCQGLQEGKLRVRCSVCNSGAFIVLRDPICWDDVLQPNQVPGSCETPNCSSSFSQFYFKCSSHVTLGEDDSCPPLPQVKRNPDSVPCLACGDAKDQMFVFDCSHATCIECFQQYTLLKLNERQFIQDSNSGYSLGCPALCQDSLIKDCHHFRLMGKTQYDRYQRFATEEYVLNSGGILCPQPDCGMGIIPVDSNCNKIACLHGCGFVFCRRCLEGWHMGECGRESENRPGASGTVSSYPTIGAEMVARAQWEDATRRTIKILTKPCPKCRVPIERNGGCVHMECPKCSFNWCWICQIPWNRECMGNHWFE